MKQNKTRTVTDSLGNIEIPADALYGAQTQRAIQNFPLSGIPMPQRIYPSAGLDQKRLRL